MTYNGFHQPHYNDATNRAQHPSSRYLSQQQQQQPMSSTGHSLQHPAYAQGQAGYGWPAQSAERSGREDMSFGNGRWGSGQHQHPQDFPQQRQQPHGSLNSVPAAAFFQSPRQSQPSLNATAVNNRVYGSRTEASGSSMSGSRSSTPLSGNRGHQRASLPAATVNHSVPPHAQRSSDFLANLTNPAEPPDPSPHQPVSAPMYSGLPFQPTSSNFQRDQVSSPYQPQVTTYPTTMSSSLPVVDTPEETAQYSASHPNPTHSQPANRKQTGLTSASPSYGTPQNRERSTNLGPRRDHYAYQKPPTPEVPPEPISSRSNSAQRQPMSNFAPAVSRASPMMKNSYEPTRPLSPDGTGVANLLSNIRGQGHQSRLPEQVLDSNTTRTHNTSPLHVQSNTATPVDTPKYQYTQPSPTTHMPGFVDPSFIYDPYHDERRRAQAAEIEAERNQPEEETNNAEPTSTSTSMPAVVQPNDSKTAADAHDIAVSALNAGASVGNAEQNGGKKTQSKPQKKTENKQPKKQPKKRAQPKEKPQPKEKAQPTSSPKQVKKRGPRPRKSTASAAAEPTPSNTNTNTNPPAQESSASIANLLTSSQEQPSQDMALEMKSMIDRMREFKTKDPSLFSKLWEDLKKGQPQAGRATGAQAPQGDQRTSPPAKPSKAPEPSASQNGPEKSNGPLPDFGNLPTPKRKGRPKKQPGTASSASSKKQAVAQVPQGYQPMLTEGAPSSAPHSLTKQPTSPGRAKPHDGQSEDSQPTSQPSAPAPSTTSVGGTADNLEQAAKANASPGQAPQTKPVNTTSETLWPEEKQKSVAHEVSRYILSNPENKDKDNPESLILAFINQKPSYGDLCQMIESRGFSLNRGDLARHILRVIPDLNASRPSPPVQQPQQSQQSQQAQQPPTSSPSANQTHPPIGSVQYNNTGHWAAPSTQSTQSTKHPAYQAASQVSHSASLPQRNDQPPQAAPKPSIQTTAAPPTQTSQPTPTSHSGKSSIPHILRDSPGLQSQPAVASPLRQSQGKTGTSPNANRLPKGYRVASVQPNAPAPNTKEAMARKRDFSDIVDLTQGLSDEDEDEEDLQAVAKASRSEDGSTSAAISTTSAVDEEDLQAVAKASRSEDGSTSAAISTTSAVVSTTPMAVPTTPAAVPSISAVVPSMSDPVPTRFNPFQSHVGALGPTTQAQRTPEQFPKPFSKFDLSAFKRSEDSSRSNKESLRRRADIVQPINKTEALRTSYYDPKTIARDILIAAGRHPIERPLNSHLSKLQDTFLHVDNSSDLGTFRWDLVDPGGPALPNVEPVPVITRPPNISKPEHRPPVSQPSDLNDEVSREPKKHASPIRTSLSAKTHMSSSHHRPSNLHISQTVDSAEDEVTPTRRKEDIVQDSSAMATSTPTIPAPRRRRGRPKSDARRSLPSTSAAASKKIEVAVPIRQLPPKYSVYECKWQECGSKLHNIETLQKHFQKVHGNFESDRKHPCLWSGCRIRGKGSSPPTLTPGELHDHVRKSHFEPMAWNLGEGPSVRRNDGLDLDKVLNDSDGRIVTPAAATHGPRDSLLLPAGSVPIRAFHKARGNVSDYDKAEEMLRALQWKKFRIGMGLDRSGCTVGNFKRLRSAEEHEEMFQFVDDEGER